MKQLDIIDCADITTFAWLKYQKNNCNTNIEAIENGKKDVLLAVYLSSNFLAEILIN
ncbi:hypothetical protein ACO0LM_25925 [Undibacterium sp. Di26W]|uniref:hypothetical protein n=1 Tax=Undibacterium sp. Di26W TaxID=3413035 RepID=UPI003BF24BE2